MPRHQYSLRTLLWVVTAAACCVAPMPTVIDLLNSASQEAIVVLTLLGFPGFVVAVLVAVAANC